MSLAAQGSPEWHIARAGKIKASVCGALEGKHAYTKPEDLVRQEVRALAGAESEFVMSAAVAHGNKMEDHARKVLEGIQGYTVEETGLVVHREYEFLAASPDGLVGIDGSIEIKCPYPLFTKSPYSVYQPNRAMYLMQVYMVMEVLDADWCDFFCYLAKNEKAEPQYTLERVERKQDFLTENLSRKYLPQPAKGTISRLDLYHCWYKWIQEQHRDEVTRAVHINPIKSDEPEVIKHDEELNRLTAMQDRIADIKSRIGDDLEALDVLGKTSESLKKDIATRYEGSVSNGRTTVKVIMKNPAIDYRKAFEFLGGEDEVLNKDESIDSFRRTTGAMQVQIQHGDVQ